MKKLTQQQIADRLGLSRPTVSRVLRGIEGPSADTAAKILQVAREIGYQLPATPRSFSRRRSAKLNRVPVAIVLGVSDEKYQASEEVLIHLLRGAEAASREKGAFLEVHRLDGGISRGITSKKQLPASVAKGEVEGVILAGQFGETAVAAFGSATPCVRVAVHHPGMDLVGQNDSDAAGDLVRRLKSLGHERIGYFGGTTRGAYKFARFGGYIEALAREGLPADLGWAVNLWSCPDDGGIGAVEEAIRQGVTAWVCAHDDLGYRLIALLRERGIEVPRDVSVCGFDNLHVPDGMPSLLSIRWPFEQMAAASVDVLLGRIRDPMRPPVQLLFDGRLIDGESAAAPRR
jgi:DNA-binding LacI/PurR family transcriptional regulator